VPIQIHSKADVNTLMPRRIKADTRYEVVVVKRETNRGARSLEIRSI
jgi:hypothetical protein